MDLGNILIIIMLCSYIVFFINLINSKNRKHIQTTNAELDEIRKIRFKTIEQQKRFLDLTRPKGAFKFSWGLVLKAISFAGLFFGFYKLFEFIDVHVPLWLGILCLLIVPMLVNFLLRKFGLQRNDDITRFI